MLNPKHTKESEKYFILAISVIFFILALITIKGIFILIIFSLVFSYFLYPIYLYYMKKWKNPRIGALLTLLTATFVFFLPFALLSYFLILNLIKILLQYKIYIENPEILNSVLANFFEKFTNSNVLSNINFSEIFNTAVIYISDLAKNFFSSIPRSILYFFIILFLTYYILTYNKKILHIFNEYIPLSYKKQEDIFENIKKNLTVLFRGYFLTGIIQTAVALFGYIIFGAPNVLILTFLTLIVSLIPYLGTPLVWVPVSFYMMVVGDTFNGTFLFLYGVIIISMIDNFVRPILMSAKDTISPPLVFVGFVGGLMAFGISGIFLGPIIISITMIFLDYVKEYYFLDR